MVSISVGATTWQDTQNIDDSGLLVALEAYAPVADTQAPFVAVDEPNDIASRGIIR
jgi:hypothetical protein